jgi:hypothetical protein
VTDDLGRILERSLAEGFDEMRHSTPLPAPRYAPVASRRGTFRRRLRFGVPLVLGTNMLVGVSVITVAAASVGAKTVVTGSPNPLVWGHHSTLVSPSPTSEDNGRDGRSSKAEPTTGSRGSESPGDGGNHASGSDDGSPEASPDSSGDGGQNGGGDDAATPTSAGGGGKDGDSSSSQSPGSHH